MVRFSLGGRRAVGVAPRGLAWRRYGGGRWAPREAKGGGDVLRGRRRLADGRFGRGPSLRASPGPFGPRGKAAGRGGRSTVPSALARVPCAAPAPAGPLGGHAAVGGGGRRPGVGRRDGASPSVPRGCAARPQVLRGDAREGARGAYGRAAPGPRGRSPTPVHAWNAASLRPGAGGEAAGRRARGEAYGLPGVAAASRDGPSRRVRGPTAPDPVGGTRFAP